MTIDPSPDILAGRTGQSDPTPAQQGHNTKPQKGSDTMRKDPFPVKSILESLRDDLKSGALTLHQAAEELCKAGWSNFVDEDKARRLLNL